MRKAGVVPARLSEKSGIATLARPQGALIWVHAASVGESLSVLALIAKLGENLPQAKFLITSGTATSAAILRARLPERTHHQFAPLDAPGPLRRFLDHWSPDAVLFVESELWPRMLFDTARRGIPMALINARLSQRSVQRWKKRGTTARALISSFAVITTQTAQTASDLIALGANQAQVQTGPNLKSLADPLPVDTDLLSDMQHTLQTRPVWIGASTHPGEEQIILKAHAKLLKSHPDLCLILAPRHPERGDEVADLISQQGWAPLRRSQGARPTEQVFLADTLGELGTWYAISRIVCLGGAFRPHGGHNPIEPAQAGAAVITGPDVKNFQDIFDQMHKAGAAFIVQTSDQLSNVVGRFLNQPTRLDAASQAAKTYASAQAHGLDQLAQKIQNALDLHDA